MSEAPTGDLPSGLDKLPSNVAIAIEISCGFILIALIGTLIFFFCRIIAKHKRLLHDLEDRGVQTHRPNVTKIPTSTPGKWKWVLRRQSIFLTDDRHGWDSLRSLNSKATGEEGIMSSGALPAPVMATDKEAILGISLPFMGIQYRNDGLPLDHTERARLSTVIESPVSTLNAKSPRVPAAVQPSSRKDVSGAAEVQAPKPIRPTRPSTGLMFIEHTPDPRTKAQGVTRKRIRANSIAYIERGLQPSGSPDNVSRTSRPLTHRRSISLCSQSPRVTRHRSFQLPSHSDSGKAKEFRSQIPRAPSTQSLASSKSANSLAFVHDSNLHTDDQTNIQLKRGANHDWEASLIAGSRRMQDIGIRKDSHRSAMSQTSIRSKTARYSSDSIITDLSRANSVDSYLHPRTSPHQKAELLEPTASVLSRSIVNSVALQETQETSTPRHSHKPKVSTTGSPIERKKSLRHDQISRPPPPSRQSSQNSIATRDASSTRSSNGNPFQFETSPMISSKLPRPPQSALKGSPNARKGHKRQSFVRLALQPTYLGPPKMTLGQSSLSEEQEPHIHRQDPSISPTLQSTAGAIDKFMDTYELQQITESSKLIRAPNASPLNQHPVHESMHSPTLSVPKFPSPCRVKAAEFGPPPTFVYTRPSNEFDVNEPVADSPFGLAPRSVTPAQLAIVTASDNEEPRIPFTIPQALNISRSGRSESFAPPPGLPEPESPVLGIYHASSTSEPSTVEMEGSAYSPPCSPRTQSEEHNIVSSPGLTKHLHKDTSPAIYPQQTGNKNITTLSARAKTTTESSFLSQSPVVLSTFAQSHKPSPTILGPRKQPPLTLRDSVIKLRRMNSDARSSFRSDRRYLRLGREASPTLARENSLNSLFTWAQVEAANRGSVTSRYSMASDGDGERRNESMLSGDFTFTSRPDVGGRVFEKLPVGAHKSNNDQNQHEDKAKLPTATQSQDSSHCEPPVFLESLHSPSNSSPIPSPLISSISSSIWDHGEKFWEATRTAFPRTDEDEKENWEMTALRPQPRRRSHMRKSAILNATLLANLGTVGMEGAGGEMERERGNSSKSESEKAARDRSPESLYDREGFLRGLEA